MAKTLDQYNKKYDWSLEMFFYIFLKKKKEQVIDFNMVTFYFVINFKITL